MRVVFAGDGRKLVTFFSSGGRDNEALPAESRYRTVAPMALTVAAGGGILPTAPPGAIAHPAFGTGRAHAPPPHLAHEHRHPPHPRTYRSTTSRSSTTT